MRFPVTPKLPEKFSAIMVASGQGKRSQSIGGVRARRQGSLLRNHRGRYIERVSSSSKLLSFVKIVDYRSGSVTSVQNAAEARAKRFAVDVLALDLGKHYGTPRPCVEPDLSPSRKGSLCSRFWRVFYTRRGLVVHHGVVKKDEVEKILTIFSTLNGNEACPRRS